MIIFNYLKMYFKIIQAGFIAFLSVVLQLSTLLILRLQNFNAMTNHLRITRCIFSCFAIWRYQNACKVNVQNLDVGMSLYLKRCRLVAFGFWMLETNNCLEMRRQMTCLKSELSRPVFGHLSEIWTRLCPISGILPILDVQISVRYCIALF